MATARSSMTFDPQRRSTGIVGPNGAGKTTLIECDRRQATGSGTIGSVPISNWRRSTVYRESLDPKSTLADA
jgi:ABC-type cobalamin/Fe3+-siderophores transport system ATPase subunit